MSTAEVSAPAPETAQEWPVLNLYERRVLGVLIEKQKTTPDAYPLSMNGLVTGCNQKSNREPVMNLADLDVEEVLQNLKQKGLVLKITGSGRVERWRHNLYDVWNVSKVELAILADLLLRGAQTEGELRTHASRMDDIADLETLRSLLAKLVERKLVIYLSPPGQRGSKVIHGFCPPKELDGLRRSQGSEATVPAASSIVAPAAALRPTQPENQEKTSKIDQDVGALKTEIQALRSEVMELKDTLGALQEEFKDLKTALGA